MKQISDWLTEQWGRPRLANGGSGGVPAWRVAVLLAILLGAIASLMIFTFATIGRVSPNEGDSAALPANSRGPKQHPTGDKAAKEEFDRIEKRIVRARTLRVSFDLHPSVEGPPSKISGTLLLKEGGKLRFSYKLIQLGKETPLLLISDGQKLVCAGRPDLEWSIPADFDRSTRTVVARVGAFMLRGLTSFLNPGDFREPFSQERYRVFSFGRPVGETSGSLTYTLNVYDDEDQAVELRFNPNTLAFLSRRNGGRRTIPCGSQYSEEYKEFIIDSDISDDEFKLPEKK